MQLIDKFQDIANIYDSFIFDQWGVLYNGLEPFDGAITCLSELKNRGKSVLLLSNSGKTAAGNAARLTKLGIPPNLFDFISTSGELLKRKLIEEAQQANVRVKKCYLIMSGNDKSFLEGTRIQETSLREADFILLCNLAPDHNSVNNLLPLMKEAVARNIPMISANSDFTYTIGDETFPGNGQATRQYELMGGRIMYFGKPDATAFTDCIIASKCTLDKILMVGDSLLHDIRGANAASIDGLFIAGGVHKNDLPQDTSPEFPTAVEQLCARMNANPKWVMSKLQW